MAKIIKSGIVNTVKSSYNRCMLRIGLYAIIALAGVALAFFTYGISLILLLSLFCIKRERVQMLILKHGIEGEIATTVALKGLPRRYYVCPDVTISGDGHSAQMDHVVVGPNGVFVVETKNHIGKIYGDDNDYALLQKKKTVSGSRYAKRFYSPIKQVTTHTRVLGRVLEQNGYKIPVQGVVYFSHPQTKVKVYSEEIPVFSARRGGKRKLRSYIKRYGGKRILEPSECKIIAHRIANYK